MKFSEWTDAMAWAKESEREMEPIGYLESDVVETWEGKNPDGKYLKVEVMRDVEEYLAHCIADRPEPRRTISCEVVCWRLHTTVGTWEDNEAYNSKEDAYNDLSWYKDQDSSLTKVAG